MLKTFQGSWELLAEFTQGDMTAYVLDGTFAGRTWAFSDKPAKAKEIPPEANGIEIVFIGDGTGGFAYDLWSYAAGSGFAEKIADGTVMVDATALNAGTPKHDFPWKDVTPNGLPDSTNLRFAGLITVNSRHIRTVNVTNSGATNCGPAKLDFDSTGLKWLYLSMRDISTDATDPTAAWAIYRYF